MANSGFAIYFALKKYEFSSSHLPKTIFVDELERPAEQIRERWVRVDSEIIMHKFRQYSYVGCGGNFAKIGEVDFHSSTRMRVSNMGFASVFVADLEKSVESFGLLFDNRYVTRT